MIHTGTNPFQAANNTRLFQ